MKNIDVDVYFFQNGLNIHCWEATQEAIADTERLEEAVYSTGLVEEGIPIDYEVQDCKTQCIIQKGEL